MSTRTAICCRCHQRVRIHDNRRGGAQVIEQHAKPGQEHLPWEFRKPCGSNSVVIGSIEKKRAG